MYSLRSLVFTILYASVFFSIANAEEPIQPPKQTKVGLNVLSLLLIGDINVFYERSLGSYFSTTFTGHYVGQNDIIGAEGQGYRISGGLRTYETKHVEGVFAEGKIGYSYYTNNSGIETKHSGPPLSIEFYAGASRRLNEMIFADAKIGLMRFLQSGNVNLSGAVNFGAIF